MPRLSEGTKYPGPQLRLYKLILSHLATPGWALMRKHGRVVWVRMGSGP